MSRPYADGSGETVATFLNSGEFSYDVLGWEFWLHTTDQDGL
jgi:hypothetical protein